MLDLWAATGRNVACYFFDGDCLYRALVAQGFPERKARKLSGMAWPDCAIYNSRYFVAYHRNGNGSDGGAKPEAVNHEGVVKIWTTDLDPRDRNDPEDEEERVALLAKGVRTLFDHLEEQENNGQLAVEGGYFCKLVESYIEKIQRPKRRLSK